MGEFLEDRVFRYIKEGYKNGNTTFKVNEIASELGASKIPVYNAIRRLTNEKKLNTKSRGRTGLEIIITEKENCENNCVASEKRCEEGVIDFKDMIEILNSASTDQLICMEAMIKCKLAQIK